MESRNDGLNAVQARLHLRRQSRSLRLDLLQQIERLRRFRNGAIILLLMSSLAMITKLMAAGLDVEITRTEAVSHLIALATGGLLAEHVRRRSRVLAGSVLIEMAAMVDTVPTAIRRYERRSWRDAFAPWMTRQSPTLLGRLIGYMRGRPGRMGRMIDQFVPSSIRTRNHDSDTSASG